jgi:hypothetical protein
VSGDGGRVLRVLRVDPRGFFIKVGLFAAGENDQGALFDQRGRDGASNPPARPGDQGYSP